MSGERRGDLPRYEHLPPRRPRRRRSYGLLAGLTAIWLRKRRR